MSPRPHPLYGADERRRDFRRMRVVPHESRHHAENGAAVKAVQRDAEQAASERIGHGVGMARPPYIEPQSQDRPGERGIDAREMQRRQQDLEKVAHGHL